MQRVRIVSEGGIGYGTKVTLEDGTNVPGVTKLALKPITVEGAIEVEVTLNLVGLDIEAHAFLSLESLTEAAAIHGLALIPAKQTYVETTPLDPEGGFRSYRRASPGEAVGILNGLRDEVFGR